MERSVVTSVKTRLRTRMRTPCFCLSTGKRSRMALQQGMQGDFGLSSTEVTHTLFARALTHVRSQ